MPKNYSPSKYGVATSTPGPVVKTPTSKMATPPPARKNPYAKPGGYSQ